MSSRASAVGWEPARTSVVCSYLCADIILNFYMYKYALLLLTFLNLPLFIYLSICGWEASDGMEDCDRFKDILSMSLIAELLQEIGNAMYKPHFDTNL